MGSYGIRKDEQMDNMLEYMEIARPFTLKIECLPNTDTIILQLIKHIFNREITVHRFLEFEDVDCAQYTGTNLIYFTITSMKEEMQSIVKGD